MANLPQAYARAQRLQDMLELSWNPTIALMEEVLDRSSQFTEHQLAAFHEESRAFTDRRVQRLRALGNRLVIVVIAFVALLGLLAAAPLLFLTMEWLSISPFAVSCLYIQVLGAASIPTLYAAAQVQKERKRWRNARPAGHLAIPTFTQTPPEVSLFSRFFRHLPLTLFEWIPQLRANATTHFDHMGLEGELQLLKAIAGSEIAEGLDPDREFVILIHGLLLDKALDGDVILICSRGIFLLECKHWKGLIEFQAGEWIHMVASDHPDAVHGWLYKEEADPVNQFQRELRAIFKVLKSRFPDLNEEDLGRWVDGGIVFTHPDAELQMHDPPAVHCKDIRSWMEQIRARPPIAELSFSLQLQIAQALLDHAARLGDFPDGMLDAELELDKLVKVELNRLTHSDYFDRAQHHLQALSDLRARIARERNRLEKFK
ncbi:MAG: NERD domain-containing protein [Chloroflexi bacterium]|nr:NERD domain-containing protein [Chloroflexota bacterium]